MVVPILLWVIYFAVNGALGDAVTAYLTNNIFLYGDGALTLAEHVKEIARYMRQNALWVIPAAVGMGILLCDRGETRAVRLCMLAMLLGQGVTVLLLGRVWRYSLLALAPFAAIGIMQALPAGASRRISEKEQPAVRADAWSLRAESGSGMAAYPERLSARAKARKPRAGASGGVY